MKALWRFVSILAIVNLLALTVLGAWLWKTQRLDKSRVDQIRELLALPIGDAEVEAQTQLSLIEEEQFRLMEERKRTQPSVMSASQIDYGHMMSEQERMRTERLQQEKEILLEQLERKAIENADLRASLDEQREAIASVADEQTQRINDEQFKQVVRDFESISPRQAKDLVINMVESGDVDEVVEILDAMGARARANILKAFRSEDELKVATDLLQRLRKAGPDDGSQENAADDQPGSITDGRNSGAGA